MTPMTTLKAIPGLGLGIAAINFSPRWQNNTPEMFVQFFGWVFVLICGGVIAGSLLWQFFWWQVSYHERGKSMRAMRSETGQKFNPLEDRRFTNGGFLFAIGLACHLSMMSVARHANDWMIYGILDFLSQMTNWPILKSISSAGLIMVALGTISAAAPFVGLLFREVGTAVSTTTSLGRAIVKRLPWRNEKLLFLIVTGITMGILI